MPTKHEFGNCSNQQFNIKLMIMRRSSLTLIQAQAIGNMLHRQRALCKFSLRALAKLSGIAYATIADIERGDVLTPQPSTLAALAQSLGLPVADVFTIAGWLPAGELPTLRPYLRAKYQNLDEQAIADLEAYADQLTRRHGRLSGPADGEDESPD